MQFGEKWIADRLDEKMQRMETSVGVIPILAIGRGWLLAEKPAGLSMHNEPGRDLCTALAEALAVHPAVWEKPGWDLGFGLHPVHRLDRDTSGLVLLAGSREAFRQLSHQFQTRQVKKRYVALVHGNVPESGGEWGMWDRPLSTLASGRKHPEGRGRRVASQTAVRVLRRSPHYSLIECEPLTGRQHQIRRHARLYGHPVVGDRRYGTSRALTYLKRHCGFERLALHAAGLSFHPPESPTSQEFTTPGLPSEITALLENDADLKDQKETGWSFDHPAPPNE
jgi:RluA family pseudouridine synthase